VSLLEEPICVVVGRTRHKMVQIEIQEAAKQGARLIELRLDFLAKAPDFKRLLENKPCPVLATVRRPEDGGRWAGTEEALRVLLRQAIVSGFDWVDLETDIADTIPRFGKVKRIVSYHNLREAPADLEKIHEKMCRQDADVVKLAVRATSPADNLRVLALLRNAPKPTVALCMGDLGLPSRLLGARWGSPFTYAAFNKERGIAPGLLSYQELKQIYGYDRINSETRVFGVIGDPVAHSLSPLIHNLSFRKLGINAVYIPFRVPRGELVGFLKAFDAVPVQGYSVTIPHKENAAALATTKDPAVEQTQAANTLIRTADGWAAFNTDYLGILDTLKHAPAQPAAEGEAPAAASTQSPAFPSAAPSGRGVTLQGRTALVLGSGGVARAAAFALAAEGAGVTLANRTTERAQRLAEDARCRYVEWAARHSTLADLVVNCTSVGMHPNTDESPLHPSYLKPGLTVFDTVYTPENTLLIKQARQRGCHIITGVELFVRQAAAQFQLFTGQPAPTDFMRKLVKKALSPVTIKEE
jgi:3-dehydroquinate dehydratase/shikimate dehydrogenase